MVLAAWAPLFVALRLAGSAYLIYLGLHSLLRAKASEPASEVLGDREKTRPRVAFAQGLISNLSNVKMVAFFLGLLPPFAGQRPSFAILLALGLNFCLLTFIWLAAYTFAVERLGGWLRRRRVGQAMEALLGSVLTALGIRVAHEALAG
jgi:threonine/homoserine/homoserine lactone efflux protein